MTTPYNKKAEKRQRNDSCTEDLENTESPKKVKARKELIEQTEQLVETPGNISPRKKLSDIVNQSGVMRDLPKRRFVDFSMEEHAASSKELEEGEGKQKISILQNALTNPEVSKPEPVKKRWLREACQDSLKWEDDFGRPIEWEEEPAERFSIKRPSNDEVLDKPTQLKVMKVPPYIIHNNEVLNSDGRNVECFNQNDKLVNNYAESNFKVFIENGQCDVPVNGNYAMINVKGDTNLETYKLNETRPTVLMHASKYSYNNFDYDVRLRDQEYVIENNFEMPYYTPRYEVNAGVTTNVNNVALNYDNFLNERNRILNNVTDISSKEIINDNNDDFSAAAALLSLKKRN